MKKQILEYDPALAIPLIAKWEGLRLRAYKCPAGIWTIGYGHTKGVRPGMLITRQQAEELLREDLIEKQDLMAAMIHVPLTEGQFIALLSFFFNVRLESIRRGSVPKLLNAGRYEEAGRKMLEYVNAGSSFEKGLRHRREAEHRYYINDSLGEDDE